MLAPSGENCQPWLFKVKNSNTIEVFLRPEQDTSLYSWGQRASYVAVGAAIENTLIACTREGYEVEKEFFPEGESSLLVVRLILHKNAEVTPDPLATALSLRCTNRKPYSVTPLESRDTEELLKAGNILDAKCTITQERSEVNALGHIGSTNEVVMLNNEYLHNFFFSHVSWTKEEDSKKKIGFFIDTLELPPPAKVGFRFISSWKKARLLNKLLGFNKIVGKQNGAVNAKASGIGLISLPTNTPASAVSAGRALERTWLTATKLGLSMQPLTGILYFYMRILAGETEHFNEKEIAHIKTAYNKISEIFSIGDQVPFFMFRIGRGEPPSARASRFTLEEVTEVTVV